MDDLTLFEALAGGAFDQLNCLNTREFDQNFFKKSNARGSARGGIGGFRIDRYITSFCSLLSYRADSHFLLSKTSC